MIPKLIKTRKSGDQRGWFSETYNQASMATLGIEDIFVQDNHSHSELAGTLRGLHYQLPPCAQAKLVRCVRGAIFDVAVDLRQESPTYGHWIGATLTAENGDQLYVPVGFAHGFVTITNNTEVIYKCSDFYAPQHEAGVAWNDPQISIDWPHTGLSPILSDKDRILPLLRDVASPFSYDGVPIKALAD